PAEPPRAAAHRRPALRRRICRREGYRHRPARPGCARHRVGLTAVSDRVPAEALNVRPMGEGHRKANAPWWLVVAVAAAVAACAYTGAVPPNSARLASASASAPEFAAVGPEALTD